MSILERTMLKQGSSFALESWDGKCRLCGCGGGQRLIGPEHLLESGQKLYLCSNCAGLYMAPDFSPEALDRFYRSAYRRLFVFEAGLKQDAAFYRKNLFAAYGEARAAKLEALVPRGGRVFEMGSGCGSFLGAMARRRPDVQLFASELDLNIRDVLLEGARVTFLERTRNTGDLSDGIGGGSGLTSGELAAAGPFHLITAFHSLEHLSNPSNFLIAARAALAPGGEVMIEVPDGNAPWGAWYYVHPAHLSIFTLPSLSRLLERTGFEVVEMGAHPWGSAFDGYLMMRGKRARSDRQAISVPRAPESEVDALFDHAVGYYRAWGPKYRLRALFKNTGVALLGPAIVGMWQRARYRSTMGPRIREFLHPFVQSSGAD